MLQSSSARSLRLYNPIWVQIDALFAQSPKAADSKVRIKLLSDHKSLLYSKAEKRLLVAFVTWIALKTCSCCLDLPSNCPQTALKSTSTTSPPCTLLVLGRIQASTCLLYWSCTDLVLHLVLLVLNVLYLFSVTCTILYLSCIYT